GLLDRLSLTQFATYLCRRLRVADRPARRDPIGQAEPQQPLNFVYEAGLPHSLHPRIQSGDKLVAGRLHTHNAGVGNPPGVTLGQACTERLPRYFDDLEGPHDAATVVGAYRLRRSRVEL